MSSILSKFLKCILSNLRIFDAVRIVVNQNSKYWIKYWIKVNKSEYFLILFFRLQNIVGLYHNIQCNILMLEYRGYGLSQGSPSEEGFYMDARAGIDYLSSRTDINTNEIIVFGRSLGNNNQMLYKFKLEWHIA